MDTSTTYMILWSQANASRACIASVLALLFRCRGWTKNDVFVSTIPASVATYVCPKKRVALPNKLQNRGNVSWADNRLYRTSGETGPECAQAAFSLTLGLKGFEGWVG